MAVHLHEQHHPGTPLTAALWSLDDLYDDHEREELWPRGSVMGLRLAGPDRFKRTAFLSKDSAATMFKRQSQSIGAVGMPQEITIEETRNH